MEDEFFLIQQISSLSNAVEQRSVERLEPFACQIEHLLAKYRHILDKIKKSQPDQAGANRTAETPRGDRAMGSQGQGPSMPVFGHLFHS